MHRRQWVCNEDCKQKFPTKTLMAEHLRNDYSSSLAQQQLPILVAMSERPIDEDEIFACPLCPDELYLGNLQNHLAEHLETISLFVLPAEVDEDEDEDIDSNNVAKTRPNPDQDESGTQSTLSSLGFSQSNETGQINKTSQTREEFSKLLLLALVEDKEKCEIWGANEAISAAMLESNMVDTPTKHEDAIRPGMTPLQQEIPHAQDLPSHGVLGQTYPSTMTSMAELASTCRAEGRWKEAEELEVQVMEMSSRMFGLDHPDTVTSMENLGFVLKAQGKYAEAEDMYQQALKGYEKIQGPEHTSTLNIVNNLGLLCVDLNRFEEAEKMYKQVLEGSEKILGLEHPDTLVSMSNLAGTLSKQGKYAEAEKMHRETLALMETALARSTHQR
jgi:tetratricopeptide (TPR) repeat protein